MGIEHFVYTLVTGSRIHIVDSGDDSCGCCAAAAAVAAAVRLLLLALLLVAADSADCSSAPVYSRAAVSLPTCWLCCSPIGSA